MALADDLLLLGFKVEVTFAPPGQAFEARQAAPARVREIEGSLQIVEGPNGGAEAEEEAEASAAQRKAHYAETDDGGAL